MRIVFVLFPGVTQLDFTGPAQVFARFQGAELIYAAASCDPVPTDCGFAVVPTSTFTEAEQADILCVPGGFGVVSALASAPLVDYIASQASGARWVTSVCTGAFLLGAAGFLKGKRATTHWAYHHLLARVGAEPVAARVVEDGTIITAGGVTSGIDFALTLMAREVSEAQARATQLALEYDPAPPFAGGHPARAAPDTTADLRARVYDAAAARMEAALGRLV